jgi:hypothetical protein
MPLCRAALTGLTTEKISGDSRKKEKEAKEGMAEKWRAEK